MAQNELLQQIVKELERAKSPSTFCTHGKIDFEGADVSIDGITNRQLYFGQIRNTSTSLRKWVRSIPSISS